MKLNIKKRNAIQIIFALTALSSLNATAGWDEIDWGSCGPNTISRRLKLAADSKVFWISQHTDLETILETNARMYEGNKADCIYSNGSEQKKMGCILRLENQLRNISRCLDHARKMCTLHGGRC
jgi:hypothetical protein